MVPGLENGPQKFKTALGGQTPAILTRRDDQPGARRDQPPPAFSDRRHFGSSARARCTWTFVATMGARGDQSGETRPIRPTTCGAARTRSTNARAASGALRGVLEQSELEALCADDEDKVLATAVPLAGAATSSQSRVRGRSWVEAAVREAGQAQQATMSRVFILLAQIDLFSCLGAWLYGASADLHRVGPGLGAVKNCCRLVTVAFISATLSRRRHEVIEDAPQRGPRGWRGSPKFKLEEFKLEESFVVWSRTIYFDNARDDEVATSDGARRHEPQPAAEAGAAAAAAGQPQPQAASSASRATLSQVPG